MIVIGTLGVSSLFHMNTESVHAHFVRFRHALREIAVTDMAFRQRAVIEFHVKEGNLAGVMYEQLRGVYGYACMGTSNVRRWVRRTSPISRAVVDRELQQLSATRKNSTSSSDKTGV
jgi:hypothetical protein